MAYTLGTIEKNDRRANRCMDELLSKEGISRDNNLDYSCGIFDEGELIAVGSCFGNTLRCLAVSGEHRGEGLLGELVSHLVQVQAERGNTHIFVYTKSESAAFFRDLGFYTVAEVKGGTAFLENRRGGFQSYCEGLKGATGARQAAIVMNANPFTLGHRYLVQRAAEENDLVHVFVLSENASLFPFDVRWELVKKGVSGFSNVVLHESGDYIISSSTFPGYFFREKADVAGGHAVLDAVIFAEIAKTLGVRRRYLGEEPESVVTGIYNCVLKNELPARGIECTVIPRLCEGGEAVSAGRVRQLIHDGRLEAARSLVPGSTWTYLNSDKAMPVIRKIMEQSYVKHN